MDREPINLLTYAQGLGPGVIQVERETIRPLDPAQLETVVIGAALVPVTLIVLVPYALPKGR